MSGDDVETIKAFEPGRHNAKTVDQLRRLGFLVPPVLDVTYGLGVFWSDYRPDGLVASDANPAKGDHSWNWAKDPIPREWFQAFGTAVVDPPYKLSGTPTDDDRYGVDVKMTVAKRMALVKRSFEAAKWGVANGGYLWVKYMDQVSSGKMYWQSDLAHEVLSKHWVREVRMYVDSGDRVQRSQKRPRNNYSTFEVWRAPAKGMER